MIDSRVYDAIKQQAQKLDWLLTEAAVGDDKVGLLLPEEMAAEITAQDTASLLQTGDTLQITQEDLPLIKVVRNAAQAEVATLPPEVATTLPKGSDGVARTTIAIVKSIVQTATFIPLRQKVKVNKDWTGEVLGTAVARDTVVPEVKDIVCDS